MLKIQLLGLALVALFTLGAVVASSAFASVGLVDGAEPTVEYLLDAVAGSEVLLEESVNKPNIDCKVLLVDINGLPAPEAGHLEVLEVVLSECLALNLGSIECTVTLDNLPWLGIIDLVAGEFIGLVLNGGSGVPGWKADCTVLTLFEVLCEALLENGAEDFGAVLSNISNGNVDIHFKPEELGKCSNGGVGFVEGLVEVLETLGLSIAVS